MTDLRALLDQRGDEYACPESSCSCSCLAADAVPEVFAAVRALLELAQRSRDRGGLVCDWEIELAISVALTEHQR